jgi:hypothetical protein
MTPRGYGMPCPYQSDGRLDGILSESVQPIAGRRGGPCALPWRDCKPVWAFGRGLLTRFGLNTGRERTEHPPLQRASRLFGGGAS